MGAPKHITDTLRVIKPYEKKAARTFGQRMYAWGLTSIALKQIEQDIGIEQFSKWAQKKEDGTYHLSEPKKLATAYIMWLDRYWSGAAEGYTAAPDFVKTSILDITYHVGPSLARQPGMKDSVNDWDWYETSRALLSSATVDGRTVMGLAKRRAEAHNRIVEGISSKARDFTETQSVKIYELRTVDDPGIPVYSGLSLGKRAAAELDKTLHQPFKVKKIIYDPSNDLVYQNGEGQEILRLQKPRDLENSKTSEVGL